MSTSKQIGRRPFVRLNVGCGSAPTPGWVNVDGSLSVALGRHPYLVKIGTALRLITAEQLAYIQFCRTHAIRRGDATKRLPVEDSAADVVYASHMFEHLDRDEARQFLQEAFRVLRPGGHLRLVIPDLAAYVAQYSESHDGDHLIAELRLAVPRARTWRARLRALASRSVHRWMYDARSLGKVVASAGFIDVAVLQPGVTTIPDPGALNLREGENPSLYLEAIRAP